MKTYTSYAAAVAAGAETIIKDSDTEFRGYMPGEIQRPEPPQAIERTPIEEELAASPALRALVDEIAKLKSVSKEKLVSDMNADAQVDAVFKPGATL